MKILSQLCPNSSGKSMGHFPVSAAMLSIQNCVTGVELSHNIWEKQGARGTHCNWVIDKNI